MYYVRKKEVFMSLSLREKCPYSELFWSVFSAFRLNMGRYGVSLRIQSECGKIRTRITPNTDTKVHFKTSFSDEKKSLKFKKRFPTPFLQPVERRLSLKLKNVSYYFTRILFMKGSHLWIRPDNS